MKNILGLVLTATLTLCASFALADEVKTPHFSIRLPYDWTQPNEVISQQGSSVVLFQNTTDGTAVTVTVVDAPMSAKDVAEQTIKGMKSGGIAASAPKEENGFYVSTFEQDGAKGISYFGSNGKTFAVTSIVGPDLNTGKTLLKNLKSTDAKLIPAF